MFGLEKKPKAPFTFALEEDIQKEPEKKKLLLQEVEEAIQRIKSELRSGTNTEDFDNYGILLHGLSSLQKVVKKIPDHK
jgi:hypothetical protein